MLRAMRELIDEPKDNERTIEIQDKQDNRKICEIWHGIVRVSTCSFNSVCRFISI